MKVFKEESLRNFDFWSNAIDTADALTSRQLDTIEAILEDLYPEGIDATTLNDIFRFEEDWLAEMLGYSSFEKLVKANNGDDDEDDEEEYEEDDE